MKPEEIAKLIAGSTSQDVESLKDEVQKINYIMVGLVVVFFIGFLGVAVGLGAMIVDEFRSKEASYSELIKTISDQNTQIRLQEEKINQFLISNQELRSDIIELSSNKTDN